MTVLVAPDSFGDTLTAVAAADCIAAGWLSARSDDTVLLAPQSDGGPGFVDVLASRLGIVHTTRVSGPLGAAVEARWLLDTGTDGATAYLECAQCCGLHQLGGAPTPRTALAADSSGLGQLIVAALAAGASRLVVGLGGSSTSDGGAGLIGALGGPDAARELLSEVEIVVASDVENPLLGPLGAASVFGPQKGADHGTVAAIEERMRQWAQVLTALAGRDVADLPGRRRRRTRCGAAGAGRPSGVRGDGRRRSHRTGRGGRRRRPRDHGEGSSTRRRCGEKWSPRSPRRPSAAECRPSYSPARSRCPRTRSPMPVSPVRTRSSTGPDRSSSRCRMRPGS